MGVISTKHKITLLRKILVFLFLEQEALASRLLLNNNYCHPSKFKYPAKARPKDHGVPRLLDVVHLLIEKQKIKFILSGSNARKLKKEGANLLGGRAFEYSLMPLTALELGSQFNIEDVLNFGALPAIFSFNEASDKIKFLKSYVRTYIKTEIQMEQLVRKLDPFREFLEIAGQMNGKILNFTRISREVGVDVKTVQLYYLILEETFLGYRLPRHILLW